MLKLYPHQIKSNKTGKLYDCYKLEVGDWETIIFAKSNFEKKYLEQVIGTGIEVK